MWQLSWHFIISLPSPLCHSVSFSLSPSSSFLDTHIFVLALYNTNVSTLSVTGEQQWSRFDLDGSESEVTVIKGCSELLLALGHPLMNDMKQPWDSGTGRGGGMMEDRWQQPTHGPHLWRAQPAPSRGFTLKHTLDGTYSGGCIQTLMCTQAYKQRTEVSKHTTTYKHSPSEDILSKGCVYCRINHQPFHYIIHVLSRPLCTRGRLTFFSPPTHSDSHTRIMHWYKPQWQFSLIPSVPCCSASFSELLRVWKLGYFRDLCILYSKYSTFLGSYTQVEFVSLFNWYRDNYR